MARASSASEYSPFGIDQAPRSFLAQNGPPGCTSSTSTPFTPRRYIRMPALRLGTAGPACTELMRTELWRGHMRVLAATQTPSVAGQCQPDHQISAALEAIKSAQDCPLACRLTRR